MAQVFDLTDDNQELLRMLVAYIQSGHISFLIGSGASMPAIKTAGNIEKTINDLLSEGKANEANLASVGFIEEIDAVHAALAAPTPQVEQTLGGYRSFLSALDSLLFNRKNVLLPRQANIFTTNYDMFVEHAASLIPTVILNDGFDRSPNVSSNFPFAWERYFDRTYRSGTSYSHHTEVPTINLIKLHGSLSWKRHSGSIVFDSSPRKKLSAEAKQKPSDVQTYLADHFLILPNFKKFHSTLMDRIYYDLLRIFSNSMDRENATLFSFGFSFADEHILDITLRALRNPTAQLVIFCYDHQSREIYLGLFARHRNVLIIAPANGTNIDFARMSGFFTSLLPKVGDVDAA